VSGDETIRIPRPRPETAHGIVAVGVSDVGLVRRHNEDAFLVFEGDPDRAARGIWQLVGIADGVGGHAAGEVASELALDVCEAELAGLADEVERLDGTWTEALEARLRRAVAEADRAVRAHAEQVPAHTDMASTLLVAIFARGWLGLAHVGDSRAYLLRGGGAERLTVDHSWAEEQRQLGGMTEEEIGDSPFRQQVMRVVGRVGQAEPDITWRRLAPGDVLLLATDGLTRYLEGEALVRIVGRCEALEDAAHALVAHAKECGGRDNVTVVLARFDGLAGPPLPEPVHPNLHAE
jgi:serine/threonine protein phosphatase PrpC